MKQNRPNAVDRYIISFMDAGKDYYKADCAFRDGQKEDAIRYSQVIRANLSSVASGKVWDCWEGREVHYWEREV